MLVGDSMVREARFAVDARARGSGVDLTVIQRGQGAPCNQLDQVLDELAKAPDVLAIEWVGNATFTVRCTKTFHPDDVVAEYRGALERVLAARPPTTTVALVGIPPIDLVPWSTTWAPLDQLYRTLADADPHVAYVDTGTALAPDRRFTPTLPCSPGDRQDGVCGTYGAAPGQVVVRDPLGFHFCPVKYDFGTEDCPVPNPGADRYAEAIVTGLAGAAR